MDSSAFPLFSPSNFGCFPLFFGAIGLVEDDADDDECICGFRSAMGGRKDGFFPIFFKNPWIHVCPETNRTKSFQDFFFLQVVGSKKTCCESTQEVLLKLDWNSNHLHLGSCPRKRRGRDSQFHCSPSFCPGSDPLCLKFLASQSLHGTFVYHSYRALWTFLCPRNVFFSPCGGDLRGPDHSSQTFII